jgi:hypothetical protein
MTMVERVARALAGSSADKVGPFRDDDGRKIGDGQLGWTAWRHDARLAIAAMREHLRDMPLYSDGDISAVDIVDGYIDAALAETAPQTDEPDGDDYADRAEWKARI